MLDLELLDRSALNDIAALCARSIDDSPTSEELDGALFDPLQIATVRGDPSVGFVATTEGPDEAHVRLLVVDGAARRRGYGHLLLDTAEADARSAGHRSLTIGADPPYFLWSGVPSTATALMCLLERHHYSRVDTNFDMEVDLASVPADPGGHVAATIEDRGEVDRWMATHWPNWRLEVLRALDKGNLLLEREANESDGELVSFCAFEVNRSGFLGPVAVRPDLIGQGRGRNVLVGALNELRRRGRRHVNVGWVGPVVPYASVGGSVSNVYFVYRRDLG